MQRQNSDPAGIALSERVITADVLEQHRGAGRSGSSLRFRIQSKALLTPAANDWLREQGAAITREDTAAAPPATSTASWAILIGTHSPVVENAVSDVTRRLNQHCHNVLCSSTADAVEQAISRITRGEQQGVVIFTDRPALAACIANRQQAVRAAPICGRQLDNALLTGLDPNVLCLSPSDRTFIELRNMLEDTVRRVPAPPGQQPGG
ncbi:MAG: hypothetical protein KDA79_06920 [Planctomycetaceae bacterium]|nr:hypothetical protein [Planctomycetaceae bacterium]